MSPELVELALKKQRLQLLAAQQRGDMLARLERVESVLDVFDRAREGVRGLREHVPLLAAAALLVAVLKPRLALRIARRAWLGWIVYRKLGRSLEPVIGFFRRFAA